MSVLVVTGTGTGVGKTVVTAAVAALAAHAGRRVAVVKAAQTGVSPGAPGDLDEVRRLSGVADLHELARYPDPLAPATAARRAGRPPVSPAGIARAVTALDADLVLVEGTGGLLVHFDGTGGTIADVAWALAAPLLVVVEPGLGTLNHTALTTAELRTRGLRCLGVVVGCWPAQPDLAARCNLTDLPVVARVPLLGVLPQGAGRRNRASFAELARDGLAPELGGRWGRLGCDPHREELV